MKVAVRVLCIVPFVTGVIDTFSGVSLLIFTGARLENVIDDPVLNSQVGLWDAIWFGFGVILWRAISHLQDKVDLLRLLCGTVVLGGLARLGSQSRSGYREPSLGS